MPINNATEKMEIREDVNDKSTWSSLEIGILKTR